MNAIPRSFGLRSRIYLSTGLLVAVCCLASAIGWVGQTVLRSKFEAYEQAELVSSQVLEIDRNVQALKAKSESYIYLGSESTRQAAERLLERIVSQIEKTQPLSENIEFIGLLDEMKRHLQTFGEQLGLAAKERAIRTSLVNEQLPKKADQVQLAIADLKQSIDRSDSSQSQASLVEVMQAFGEGRKHLLQYLIDPGAAQLDRMLAALKQAETRVDSIVASGPAQHQQRCERLAQKLVEFQHLALRAVQATRGYLYYSNVVMAGEISEFVYYSNQVKQYVHRQQLLNRSARTAAANRTRTLGVIASLAALMCAGLLATGLSYSIVQPISKMTDAFRRLAAGETLKHIPETERNDEIGRMSRAAQVFNAKNQETQDLLLRSQSLSAQLATKAKALEETNQELDNFAYVASHDLKAPLRGLNSLAQWVQEDCEELLPEDSKQHLTQMQDRVRKMDILLNDLLEYSRVGRIEQQSETVDLEDLVQSIIDMTDNREQVRIQAVTPLPRIQSAIAPLKQVILNLITNAIKYNDKGDQGIIEISCQDAGDDVAITVSDNGIGIDPRYHERIFQMYQRIAPKDIQGSGMGLAMVKKQVESHGGRITLRSEPNIGTEFTFTWPKGCNESDSSNDAVSETDFELVSC